MTHHSASLLTESFDETIDPIAAREAFCRALTTARTRRGVSLEDIAAVTKVCVSYFEALERGDLTYWPKAIFRRAFFRGYVQMIGLPVDEWIGEFIRLFPDNDAPTAASPEAVTSTSDQQRLALDRSWHGPREPLAERIVAATLDVTAVLTVATATWLVGANFPVATAIVTVIYFAIARIVLDQSPATLVMRRRRDLQGDRKEPAAIVAAPPEVVPAVPPQPRDERERANVFAFEQRRAWTSDARRTRPREERPRVRVRFK